jgi:hypothetical protein
MRKTSLTVAAVCATLLWAGVAHAQRFTDNGDGTVTDHQTGLMWEKKTPTGSGSVHDVNNKYTWCASGDTGCPSPSNLADGTVFTVFLATLNNGANDKISGSGDSPSPAASRITVIGDCRRWWNSRAFSIGTEQPVVPPEKS